MFLDELQNRAHNGDQAAFRDIYNRYSREVYAVSHTALGSADGARSVVKQVFLQLYRELMRSENDLDLPARLSALTNEEIRITRIAAGDLDPESLLVQYTVASAPTVDTAHTMDRIRAHMQQNAASAAEEPAEKATEPAAEAPAETREETFEETFVEPAAAEAEEAFFSEPAETVEAPAAEPVPVKEPKPEPKPEEKSEEVPAKEPSEASAASPFEEPKKKKSRTGTVVASIILALLLIVFAWLIVGILMDLSILPFYDLGYSLFNEYVFDFFRLP